MEDITLFIAEVGFPIAATIGLGFFIWKLINRIIDGMETKVDVLDDKVADQIAQMEDRLGDVIGSTQFINTLEHNFSKDEYYDLLSRAKVVVSFALQENFGFSIAEAVYLGCVPVVPNRLVYPEFYSEQYLYDTFDTACDKVIMALKGNLLAPLHVRDYQEAMERWFRD